MSSLPDDRNETMKCEQVMTNDSCVVIVQITPGERKSDGSAYTKFLTVSSTSQLNPLFNGYSQAEMVIQHSYHIRCHLDPVNNYPTLYLFIEIYCRQDDDCSYVEVRRLLALYLQQWGKLDAWLRVLLVGNSDNENQLICWSSETNNQMECSGGSKKNACMMDGGTQGCRHYAARELATGIYKMTSIKFLSANNEQLRTDDSNLSDLVCTATLCNANKTIDELSVVVGHFLDGISFPLPNSNEPMQTRPPTLSRSPSPSRTTLSTTVRTTTTRTTTIFTLIYQSNSSQQECMVGCTFTKSFQSANMNNDWYQTKACETKLVDTCLSSISIDSAKIEVTYLPYLSYLPDNTLSQKFPNAKIVIEYKIEMLFNIQTEQNDLLVKMRLFCQGKHNCSTIETQPILQSLFNETSQLKIWLNRRFHRDIIQSPLPYIECFSSQENRIINCSSSAFGCLMLINGKRHCMSTDPYASISYKGLMVDEQIQNVSFDRDFRCTTNRCNDNATLTELKDRINNYISGKKQNWPEIPIITVTTKKTTVIASKTFITTGTTTIVKESESLTSVSMKNDLTDFLNGTSKGIVQRSQNEISLLLIFYITIGTNILI